MDLTENPESSPSAHLFTSMVSLPRIHPYLPLLCFLLWRFSLHRGKLTSLQNMKNSNLPPQTQTLWGLLALTPWLSWLSQYTYHYRSLEGWSKEKQAPLA